MARLVTTAALVLAWGALGCSDPCEQNCEAYKQCAPELAGIDCAESCAVSQELAQLMGCEAELLAATECEEAVNDKCTMFEACSDAIAAFDTCLAETCAREPELCGQEPIGGGAP